MQAHKNAYWLPNLSAPILTRNLIHMYKTEQAWNLKEYEYNWRLCQEK